MGHSHRPRVSRGSFGGAASGPPSEPPSDPPDEPDGDRGDFDEIVERHFDYLHTRARNLTGDTSAAEDLVQNALVLAQKNFVKFKQGTNARAWLATILSHLFLDGLKHERVVDRALPELMLLGDVKGDPTLLDIPDAYLYAAIEALDEKQRLLIELRYYRNMSYREIAEILGVPVPTVGTRLMAAHRRLKEVLSQMIEGAPWT